MPFNERKKHIFYKGHVYPKSSVLLHVNGDYKQILMETWIALTSKTKTKTNL